MTASQIALLVLALVAFVIGWFARGRRMRSRDVGSALAIDAALGAALTSFQAVLALSQTPDESLFARSVRTFVARQREVGSLAAGARVPEGAVGPLAQARAELDRLAGIVESARLSDPSSERVLLSAERRLTSARSAFLRAVATSWILR